jgi:hypothetical protein
MPKIHQHPHPQRPTTATPVPPTQPRTPPAPPPPVPTASPAPAVPEKDGFLRGLVRGVYESSPFFMLCGKPEIRELASKIPAVSEIADTVCQAFEPVDEYVKKDLLK